MIYKDGKIYNSKNDKEQVCYEQINGLTNEIETSFSMAAWYYGTLMAAISFCLVQGYQLGVSKLLVLAAVGCSICAHQYRLSINKWVIDKLPDDLNSQYKILSSFMQFRNKSVFEFIINSELIFIFHLFVCVAFGYGDYYKFKSVAAAEFWTNFIVLSCLFNLAYCLLSIIDCIKTVNLVKELKTNIQETQ